MPQHHLSPSPTTVTTMPLNASSEDTPSILHLPPEIFPLVATHIPLQHLPATLSSLSLTTKDICSHVYPILYRSVVIKNEEYTCQLLDRISTDPNLQNSIRELHLRLNIETEVRNLQTRTTVLIKLQEVIQKGYLPRMRYLSLILLKSYLSITDIDSKLISQCHLPRSFWTNLRISCPLLQGIRVDGIEDSMIDPWVNDPNFCDLEDFLDLNTIKLKYNPTFPSEECSERLCRNVINVASTLQSLSLSFGTLHDAGSLLSITFPLLISINLHNIYLSKTTTDEAMAFWTRHTNLERVNIDATSDSKWFSDGVEHGLLPRLTHLRARFSNVRALATHLSQLEHLSIIRSYNWQTPYLLRSVLPEGLPKLKSLEIHQVSCTEPFVRSTEGAMWYEAEDGQFLHEKKIKNAQKFVDGPYLHSVAQGAPHLRELCLQGSSLYMHRLKMISPVLAQFDQLERFYYPAFQVCDSAQIEHWQTDMDDFLLRSRLLGNSCGTLKTVTDVGRSRAGPYLVGNIIRNFGGLVQEVIPGHGFGMEFADGGNNPFPLDRRP